MRNAPNNLRFDLKTIAAWIEPGSKVISLGCGEGDLLFHLKRHKQIAGTGIDQDENKVARCISRGLSVLQGDINREIKDYPDNAFDYVVLSQTLQQIYEPSDLIRDMLRIGGKVIVSFPNFSHWRSRLHLMLKGYAPVTRQLPYEWHNTPNIRVITIKDFRRYARQIGCHIIKEAAIDTDSEDRRGTVVTRLINLRATYGIFMIGKRKQ